MSRRENIIKAIRFETPEYIPMGFGINDACWDYYDQDQLFELMETHKILFPDFKRPKEKYNPNFHLVARKNQPYIDDWGCLWKTSIDGITGTVTKHPITGWSDFETYKIPNPKECMGIGSVNWPVIEQDIKKAKDKGDITYGGLRHGHTFLQLCDIRGYENLIYDMVDDEPNLKNLIKAIEEFNMYIINKYVDMNVDIIMYPEDLGMQKGPMISPEYFRKYIKPTYERLVKPARDSNIIIHMHSDGDLHELIEDLLDTGIDVINLQDIVNDIDWIAERLSGKVCVELDIDRQFVTVKGTPKQIDSLIHEEVKKIGKKEGGLMMVYGMYPGVPLKNVKAVMDAMEKYAFYY